MCLSQIETFDQYMSEYGGILAKQAMNALDPLHVPGRDEPLPMRFKRRPFEAQAHVATAVSKALDRQKTVFIVGEMGTGKTMMGMMSAHVNARSKPYHAMVFCPGHLVGKWENEIRETIPFAQIVRITSYADVLNITCEKPAKPTWWVISRNRAKGGARWHAAYITRKLTGEGVPCCPSCFEVIRDDDDEIIPPSKLASTKMVCPSCESPLYSYDHRLDRWEPAKIIQKHHRNLLEYLIVDEVHEEKGADTAQANAAGSIASVARKCILLTGTLIGGMAEHLRSMLFRFCPNTIVDEGYEWSDAMPFNEQYGRIETRITERENGSGDGENQSSRGSKRTKTKYVRPGIMPTLFGRHLLDKAVFLSLDEVAANLPPLNEVVESVELDSEQRAAYDKVSMELTAWVKTMVARGDKRLLGTMLRTLLCYPDQPWGWGEIGYTGKEGFVHCCTPPSLSSTKVRPKEQRLIDICLAEKAQGRQSWVFCQMTVKMDVMQRLASLLEAQGLRVGILRADKVSPEDREAWIAEHGPNVDVMLSHPKPVETGLDLFCKRGKHNFATIIFYQTGYATYTLRQASRRAWRIGQRLGCRVIYLYYKATALEKAMALMGRKMAASYALEGKFSSEGLAAMAGDDGSVEMALARSIADRIDEGECTRAWSKIGSDGYDPGMFASWSPPTEITTELPDYVSDVDELALRISPSVGSVWYGRQPDLFSAYEFNESEEEVRKIIAEGPCRNFAKGRMLFDWE